ncbi:class I SAM-dependent methyltransferase [candidate division KSB1 bacterium]|nr:class I SAM-dependent methyltransferase [candidate division KSB1 bacterium]
MLETYELDEYLKKVGIDLPDKERLERLIDQLSYFKSQVGNNEIINFNYERGYVLYSLVAHLKPRNILEFGTAQGFSTLCMAWAMDDCDIDGSIYTIDYVPHDKEVLQHFKKSGRINKRTISRQCLWENVAEKSWIEKIHVLTGYSSSVINKKLPPIDFFYIDGPHFYKGFKQ